jgi:uncharacterized membrane protein YoaK (UPF0700 family)
MTRRPTATVTVSPAPAPPPRQHLRIRDAMMVALTVLTGATDAIAFTRLGGVFTSVMTGNMVLIGVAIGRGTYSTLARTALAILAYIAGSMAGGRAVGSPRDDDGPWPAAMTAALLVEIALFAAFAGLWWTHLHHLTDAAQSILLLLSAVALGLQSATILRLGIPGLSTTYLTGTLTTVMHSLASRRSLRGNGRSIAILAALIVGAAIGALAARFAPAVAAAVPLTIAVAVVLVARFVLTGSRHGNS